MPWFGNSYYDPDKKKWKTQIKPKRHHSRFYTSFVSILMFVVVSVVVTIIVNHYHPGSRFTIFGW